jgi:sensor histidine kinase regulating citrate/malate metabolism
VNVVVRFSVARLLPGIEVLVADRGPRLGRSSASRRSGGGVGLQLVREFVQEAGGRLWSRDREGGGALFGIWLPAGRLTIAEGQESATKGW